MSGVFPAIFIGLSFFSLAAWSDELVSLLPTRSSVDSPCVVAFLDPSATDLLRADALLLESDETDVRPPSQEGGPFDESDSLGDY